ncbi:ATP-dependent helicase [Frisingicoccus caecimuris]|uniref:DNA 3'-5' helicase n=1 Tax=Frisingicoccus caecimuris TaxID=1796636 RepID=A0A4R2M0J6_9FIRM|nr:ATP-dependent helicase [Frisingicoccus caecimuris]MCR1917925.1 ATP-dependent helicase [Frisingicoccus caecimuris]TCO86523.1 DNA helicase-2/ATP-dependent DNA helicase PcrA [Frisingicoccus caecimuris]
MQVDSAQKKAIEHDRGPMLVLAGPGSGKTLVITRRTQWLIEKAGVAPGNILVVTFTRAAAGEMRSRFDRLMDGRHLPVSFGTFHAVFFTILKYAYNYRVDNILSEDEKYGILRDIVHQIDVEMDDEKDFLMNIAGEISRVKGDMMPLEHFYSANCSKDVFEDIYAGYEQKLRRMRRLDYDDMLVQTWQLFKERPDILLAWQKKYTYILIDEFQDINRIQYEIIRMLARPENNLFVVGDDDQSIYRFRGARPEILLGFTKDYPGAEMTVLNRNYRSTGSIVARAEGLIRHNEHRYAKHMTASREKGREVFVKAFKKPTDQYLKMIREIVDMHEQQGIAWEQIAVIFRTNIQMSGLVEQFMVYNVPFVMKDSVPNIYEHWIAKDIFAYMNIAFGNNSRADYLRIINRPNRYISRSYLDEDPVNLSNVKDYLENREWMMERIEQLEYDLYMLASMGPYPAIQYIRHSIGYDEYLKEYAMGRGIKGDDLLEVLDELMDKSHAYKTWEEWFKAIEQYSETLKIRSRQRFEAAEGVRLLTMHGAKGLEYDVVYIPDANDGLMPHKKAATESDKEEERRMFYVAMTRAKNDLRVYFTRERYGKASEMSPFVGEFLAF